MIDTFELSDALRELVHIIDPLKFSGTNDTAVGQMGKLVFLMAADGN